MSMSLSPGVRHAMREVLIWLGLFAVGLAGFFYLDDLLAYARRDGAGTAFQRVAPGREGLQERGAGAGGFARKVRLKAGRGGHFYTTAHLNGRPVEVIVDTGATGIHLTWKDARRIGLAVSERDFKYRSRTANGIARIALVRLDRVRIGDIELRNMRATVARPGRLFKTLLGMSFLGRLERVDIRGRELVLVQ